MSNGLTGIAAAALLVAAASAARALPPDFGAGPEIRMERLEQAAEAEERAQASEQKMKAEEAKERVKASVPGDPVEQQIARRLAAQQDAWNRGDIEAFMSGYWKSDKLRFASGGTVTWGWQATLDRYKKRYDSRAKMGTLKFSDLDITVLSKDAALVFGRFTLERKEDRPTGLFTLLFRKIDGKWVIVHDHTSSE